MFLCLVLYWNMEVSKLIILIWYEFLFMKMFVFLFSIIDFDFWLFRKVEN